ncbi:MAG: RNB domain-containing ribonuclease, partial [Bermanella sp.]
QEAARRSNSLYFPGRSLPMLPAELSNGLCSLLPNKNRLALVATLHIDRSGHIEKYDFEQALVCSQGKLNYQQVSDFIAGKHEVLDEKLQQNVQTLHTVTSLLNDYRQQHNLVMDDRPDYYMNVGDNGKVQNIVKAERNQAQKLVEEAMLAANLCCARFLNDIGSGIFIQHAGFRTERLGDIKTVIKDQGIAFEGELNSPQGYKALIQEINKNQPELPIKTLFSRFLTRSEFSDNAQAHAGMGFDCYTTFTSPIRKYCDLVVHRIINAHLNEQKRPEVTQQLIKRLQTGLLEGRNAVNQAEFWLKLQYLN